MTSCSGLFHFAAADELKRLAAKYGKHLPQLDRRHHIPKQRHRVTNWPAYDIALRQRGSLTVWFTEAAIAVWKASPAPRAAASRATRRWRLRRR
jgi:hypothetical protein